jgi:hypothetical protein
MHGLFTRTRNWEWLLCAWTCLHCAGPEVGLRQPGGGWFKPGSSAAALVGPSSDADVARHSTPLGLEVWATVATVDREYFGPLHPDMVLHAGDRIGVRARTTSVADVYLLHCDGRDALSIYPAGGAVRFSADQRVDLPVVGKDLRIRGFPGHETLYVVASKRPLERADPALQAVLSQAHDTAASDDLQHPQASCGRQFEILLASARWSSRLSDSVRRRFTLRGVDTSDAFDAVARAFADDDGVVVLRFAYQHAP